MALPLLEYKPSSQNHRVKSFGKADLNEDTPYIYRLEDVSSFSDMQDIIWAAYRQVFSEHEILKFNRQKHIESQLKNGSLTVRDFIRGLAKSEAFYRLVVSVNNNYRLVDICLKRFLGRSAYNKEEEIAWSIVIATKGFDGFVDALLDSDEYTEAFGDNTVPYQRKRLVDRPHNLVTPRYGEDFQESAGTVTTDWRFTLEKFYSRKFQERRLAEGDPRKYADMAASINAKGNYAQNIRAAELDYMSLVPNRSRR
ncbi:MULTISPECIES: phycobilisome rod-core linker polypeptide [Fischerella]|jgi:phycobilisome rod-core linker protein|uniref:Phycobilisome linker polypeptide n=24 Tax=Hapalosiphonaceae TaxID=1892263 RepID=G6FPK7_9CYAN|nr:MULTISPECIES: phycobilisome rod-core linker polypeptide [Fischerella]PLZ99159.1 phycobilisome rod-core linker polypeptide CpcG2 [Fischerella thermalis CCMEE 5196]PMB01791.1 phycobilisome rod-core linker polypeptide CpcG2 [Fischerella thermalis CCMEE 5273]PMB09662.1 phycobilisome rod-core linker polypeptide CpcG2 [Fischerella thermalis CCMEE 5328]PMB49186.1 phycobilisome rod-core linker polypeptide CpcG2 [Fischerella thermalis CCMEE 5205]BCX09052.1 MAG: phycobilisome rod-core linker polypept